MTNPNEAKHLSKRDTTGIKLMIVAVVLGLLAFAADLVWMVPHQSTVAVNAKPSATQEQASPTTYFSSLFTLQTRNSGDK
jgi:hypothetical protein